MATQYSNAGQINRATRIESGAVTASFNDNVVNLSGSSTVDLPPTSDFSVGYLLYITTTTNDLVTINPSSGDAINSLNSYQIVFPGQTTLRISEDGEWVAAFSSASALDKNIYKVNNSLVPDINLVSPTAIDWDSATEISTNPTLFTYGVNGITVNQDGIYKLTGSMYYVGGGNLQRKCVLFKYTINGAPQSESFQDYIRMSQGVNETSTSTGAVYNLSSGDVVNITGQRGAGSGTCQAVANNSVLIIEKIG